MDSAFLLLLFEVMAGLSHLRRVRRLHAGLAIAGSVDRRSPQWRGRHGAGGPVGDGSTQPSPRTAGAGTPSPSRPGQALTRTSGQIGRAACRETVQNSVVRVSGTS